MILISPSKKCTSYELVMCTSLSSLMMSIPSRRSNPRSFPSIIRASTCTGSAIRMSSLILPHPWHFRVLPSAINNFAFVLLPTAAYILVHQCLWAARVHYGCVFMSIYRHFDGRQCHVLYLLGRAIGIDIHSSELFSWHSDEMCPILLHRKHHISQSNLHVQLIVFSNKTCLQFLARWLDQSKWFCP